MPWKADFKQGMVLKFILPKGSRCKLVRKKELRFYTRRGKFPIVSIIPFKKSLVVETKKISGHTEIEVHEVLSTV